MKSREVLQFLDLLSRETTGREDMLAQMYQRALDDDEDVEKLRSCLEDCVFYHEIGGSLRREGETLLNRLYGEPLAASRLLPEVQRLCERILGERERSRGCLCAPEPFPESVSVLKKNEVIPCVQAMRDIASSCVHLAAVYGGVEAIKDLLWVETDGLLELVYAVNTKFLPALLRVRQPDYGWVIQKKRLGGASLFHGEEFFLIWEQRSAMRAYDALRKEPVGTHAWLNVSAYEEGLTDVPYCWGTGNLVSSTLKDALSLLSGRIVTGLRPPGEEELCRPLPAPAACIRSLSGGGSCCITPEELVTAMNRWQAGRRIRQRKAEHSCLFCGRHVPEGRLVCAMHFSERNRM